MSTILVRLRPYNKSRNCVLRSLTVYGLRFQEKRGWYEVEEEVAELLKGFKQPPVGNTPADMTPTAFEIMSAKAAVAHEEAERKAKEERARAISPHKMEKSVRAAQATTTLTTKDLPRFEPEADDVEPPPQPVPVARKSAPKRGKRTTRRSKDD